MKKPEIEANTIFLMMRGSQAYGTNLPDSDIDYGGICMPDRDVLFGIDKFEQEENWVDEAGNKVDKSIYVFNKAVDLMANNNPNILDYLFAPDRCVITCTPVMERLKENAHLFLSRDTKNSFLGYAIAQLSRIETHRQYLLRSIVKPNREEYGLPSRSIFPETQYETITNLSSEFVADGVRDAFYDEMALLLDTDGAYIVKKYVAIPDYQRAIATFKVRQGQFLRMLSSINGQFLAPEYRDMAKKELKYLRDLDNWKRYKAWEKGRNPARMELEKKCGFDCKHGSHCLRLTRMVCEIMEHKGVLVDRTNIDADELRDIRLGNQSYETVMVKANAERERAEQAYKTCTLPLKPDYAAINELKREILNDYFFRGN